MSDAEATGAETEIPEWDDEYLDGVAARLRHNYDLEKDYMVRGEQFDLYGHMVIHSEKHFLHPAVSFAHHESHEHLFVRRADAVSPASLERLSKLGHDLADAWIDTNEEHYSTEFTFVVVVPRIPDGIASGLSSLDERTLLKVGYHGHYRINGVVVAPEAERLVSSESADVAAAFRLWEPIKTERPGFLDRFVGRLRR